MGKEIQAGKAVVSVEANRSRLASGLAAAQKQLQSFAAGAAKFGGGALAGSAAVLAPLTMAVAKFADAGSMLDDMSQRTGASVEALSGLGFAAQMSGASLEDVEKGIRKMQKGLADGSSAYEELGLSTEKLLTLKPEDQMRVIADSLSQISDPATRSARAMEIFGKGGASLLPLLSTGSKGIDQLTGQAKALGVVMSGEQANSAAVLGDTIDTLGIAYDSLVNTIASAVAPAFTAVLAVMIQGVAIVRDWIAANQGVVIAVAAVATVLGLVGAGLVTAAGVAYGLSVAMGVLSAAASAAGTVMSIFASILTGGVAAAPAIVVAALVGLTGYLLYASGAGGKALSWLGEKFQMLADIAGPVFKGIQDAMSGGDFGLAAEIAWAGIQVAWYKGTEDIRSSLSVAFNKMLNSLDNFMAQFRSKWNDVSGWIADRMLDVVATFDSSFDAVEAKRMRAEDTKMQNQGFTAGAASRAAARDTAVQAAEAAAKERITALEGKLAESLAKAATTADEAAKKNAMASSALNIAEFDPAAAAAKAQDAQETGLKEAAKSSPKALGTSSGFSAAMLQGGGSSIDRQILDVAKEQAEIEKETLRFIKMLAAPTKSALQAVFS